MKNPTFSLALTLLVIFTSPYLDAQSTTLPQKPFTKVIISPHIQATFIHADEESVTIDSSTLPKEKINAVVKGKTLRIYLDDAKVTAKTEKVSEDGWYGKRSIYYKEEIKVTIRYKGLESLSIRGEELHLCQSAVDTDKFRLKLYGESKVELKEVKIDKLKVTCYGENELVIENGRVDYQKFLVYGESTIDTQAIWNKDTKVTVYGESEIKVDVQRNLKVNAIGESSVLYGSQPKVNKGLIIGETEIAQVQ